MRIGVITFPGTLDDVDAARAVRYAGAEPVSLWHRDDDLHGVDAVADADLERIAETLLANPVIEEWVVRRLP